MNILEVFGLLIPITFFVMLAVERLWPARQFPARRGWTVLGVLFLFGIGAVSTVVPLLVDPVWLARYRWFDGQWLGTVAGVVVGYLVLSALMAVWHRAVHRVPLLWRLVHQLHHSPQRVDIAGSVFFHPTEMVAQVILQLFVTLVVLGLDPVAAAATGYVAAFYGMFQHWNIHTPVWLGYLIQRPEAHCEHHREGVHAFNYSDFPLWDIVAGSWRNPPGFSGRCGFASPADRRVLAMLGCVDVNAPLYGRANLGVAMSGGGK